MSKFFFAHIYAPLFWMVMILPVVLPGPRNPFEVPFFLFLLGGVMISFLAEKISPFNSDWNINKGDLKRDFLHAVFNQLSLLVFLLVIARIFARHPFPALEIWPHSWPFFIQIFFALLIADALMTLAHFASHRIEFLWRLHSVHHSVKRVYALNGLMKHPVHKVFEATCGFLPLFLMGMPVWLAPFTGYVAGIHFLLSHANVSMENRFLSKFLALSPVHRFHHLQKRRSAVNYGIMFNFWDMLLGTFYQDPKALLKSEELGIKDYPNYPEGYVDQLILPFKGWKK